MWCASERAGNKPVTGGDHPLWSVGEEICSQPTTIFWPEPCPCIIISRYTPTYCHDHGVHTGVLRYEVCGSCFHVRFSGARWSIRGHLGRPPECKSCLYMNKKHQFHVIFLWVKCSNSSGKQMHPFRWSFYSTPYVGLNSILKCSGTAAPARHHLCTLFHFLAWRGEH